MDTTARPTKSESETALEQRAKLLASGLRRRVLQCVRDKGPIAPTEVKDLLQIPMWKATYQMRVLRESGDIEIVRTEPVRGSTKSYHVATERDIIEAPEWGRFDLLQKQVALAETFNPLVEDFNRAARAGTFDDDGLFHVWRTPLKSVDREGLAELIEIHRRLLEATDEVAARSAERMAKSDEESISVSSASQCFRVPGF